MNRMIDWRTESPRSRTKACLFSVPRFSSPRVCHWSVTPVEILGVIVNTTKLDLDYISDPLSLVRKLQEIIRGRKISTDSLNTFWTHMLNVLNAGNINRASVASKLVNLAHS